MVKRHRILIVFLLFAWIFSVVPAHASYSVPSDTVVYIADTGTKYHRHGCTYLLSSTALNIRAAVARGYEPCSRCRPDIFTGEYVSNWDGESGDSSSRGSSSHDSPSASKTPSRVESSGVSALRPVLVILAAAVCVICLWITLRKIRNKKEAERKRQEEERQRLVEAEYERQEEERQRLEEADRQLREEAERQRREEAERQRREEAERQRREEAERKRQAFLQEKQKYTALYGGKPAEVSAGMPPGVEIAPNGLPRAICGDRSAPQFLFYVAGHGFSFHRIRGCSKAYTEIHALYLDRYVPCKRCCPQYPDLAWYEKYKAIKQIKRKYQID